MAEGGGLESGHGVKVKSDRTKIDTHTDEESVLATISRPSRVFTRSRGRADQLATATVQLVDFWNAMRGLEPQSLLKLSDVSGVSSKASVL